MDLFNTNPQANLLPYDGEVIYYGTILSPSSTKAYYETLLRDIDWKNDETIIAGKRIITKRKIAWYGNGSYSYTYSNTTKQAIPWTPQLLELKALIESKTNVSYNSCLLNLYHNGNEGISWHRDSERSLGENTNIASLSFGADRKFCFKHIESKQMITQVLEKGSLLVMKGNTQQNWLHSLPPTTKVRTPRINLTFRTFIQD